MTELQREWLRTIRTQTVFEQSPLHSLTGATGRGVVIEYLAVLEWHRTGIAMLVNDSEATFFRTETIAVPLAYRSMAQHAPCPLHHLAREREGVSWQGEISCRWDFARTQMDYLTRYGLWELNDFCPAAEMLDGDYLIVRACDTERRLVVDACLFCFGESVSPYNRKLAARMHDLLQLPQTTLTAKRRGRWWS
ncbi:unnamed protein product [Tuwongella immobilis]|uniref:Uncharacterized protein n=1 Tax=Tuwongella immobilis TaxID=692036 RepID=A0A6C2YUB8_9BACT|nr:unnamed protein product [Tuwongella immobilis]VTS06845.1 unnamed protein product [Tuwongella immobilis]